MITTLPGDTVDRFKIVEQIGRGGMGEVYVGYDRILNRKVALKSIRREHRLNPEAKVRFLREARVLSQLGHPNICQIYDYIEGAEADFLVLELIHGKSLSQAMRDDLSRKQKLQIAEQIAAVLVAAHGKGVVHRDLKPDNVMLTDGQIVKVLDFGLSRSQEEETTLVLEPPPRVGAVLSLPSFSSGDGTEGLSSRSRQSPLQSSRPGSSDRSSDDVTTQGTIMGTLGHMSPEAARGEVATPASDLYSFGLMLQELFTGKSAYPDNLDKLALLAKAQAGETLPVEGLEADLAALIRRLESVEPAARPSATEALERLRWIANRPQRVRRKVLLGSVIAGLILFSIAMTLQTIRATRAEGVAKQEAARASREAEAAKKVSEFLLGIFKVSDPGEARGNTVTARELLDKGARKIENDLQAQPEIRARLMDTMGLVYLRLGLYPQAEPLLRSGLEIRRRTLGPNHPDVAQSLQNLGILSWSQGKYPEAEPLFRSAIAIRERALGPDDPELAKSLNNLAIVYKTEGKYSQAEPLYLRSFKIMEKSLGPDNPDLASSLNNLASFYYDQKKYTSAEPLFRRSLQIKEKSLGSDHPDVASTLNNLGELMTSLNKNDEAELFYQRSLAIRKKVLGATHPDVAESMVNLGSLYVVEGKLDQAEPLLVEALTIRQKSLGNEHPDVGATLSELAALRRKEHRFEEAGKLYSQACAILEKSDDPSLPSILEVRAEMSWETGHEAEAEALQARADGYRKAHAGN